MFERFTEKARRVIFFSRYEASQFGSSFIDIEHILLGVIREGQYMINTFLPTYAISYDSILKDVEGRVNKGEQISTSVDLPLSNEAKLTLAYAAEESERLKQNYIDIEHIL